MVESLSNMIKLIKLNLSAICLSLMLVTVMPFGRAFAADCTLPKSGLLEIPTWYKYLPGETANVKLGDNPATVCTPKLYTTTAADIDSNPSAAGATISKNVVAIGLAIIEIIMRLLIYISFTRGIWGGYKIIASGGNSQGFKNGIETVKNAAIGLVIGLLATAIVVFAGSNLTA